MVLPVDKNNKMVCNKVRTLDLNIFPDRFYICNNVCVGKIAPNKLSFKGGDFVLLRRGNRKVNLIGNCIKKLLSIKLNTTQKTEISFSLLFKTAKKNRDKIT